MTSTAKLTPRRIRRSGKGKLTVLAVVGFLVLAAVGAKFLFFNGDNSDGFDPILTSVTRGDFVSKVLDQGEIESSENVEIRCEVKARNGQITVLKTCPEGARVKEGDFLLQLDATGFEKELESQNLAIAAAQTRLIKAKTALQTAIASKREYTEGVYVESFQTIQNQVFDAKSQITTAEQELEQSIAVLEHSEKLHSKGFITERQLKADQFAVEKAKIAIRKAKNLLALAASKATVLNDVTKPKEETRLGADIESARVDLTSQERSLDVEQTKLREINRMIRRCTITVPQGVKGQVVFAKEGGRRGNDWVLEEGAAVRQNQVLIRLPNSDKMQVKAQINEQNITRIATGMPAAIEVDALDNTPLKGIVTKVNQYAESKGWFGSNVRKYAVYIKIIDPPDSLKPGMNASVSIESRFEEDVLQAPLQAVYSVQSRSFCLVKENDQYVTREVDVDGNNSQSVLIRSGLNEGDLLVMNAGFHKDRMDLPEVESDPRIELPKSATAGGETP